jgi:hypothetical protein
MIYEVTWRNTNPMINVEKIAITIDARSEKDAVDFTAGLLGGIRGIQAANGHVIGWEYKASMVSL